MNKTKKNIFEASVKVFSNYGYTGATMDMVMATAGVAKGTIYYHFESKEELFCFVIEEGIALINNEIFEATKDVEDSFDRMKASAKVQLRYVFKNKDLFKVILSQLWGTEERNNVLRKKVKELLDSSANQYKEIIDEGYIEERDPIFLSYAFIGMLFSATLYDLLHEDECEYEVLAEKFMTHLQYGIGVK